MTAYRFLFIVYVLCLSARLGLYYAEHGTFSPFPTHGYPS